MAAPLIEELRREAAELRRQLHQFRTLLDKVFEPGMLDVIAPETQSSLIDSSLVSSMSPAQIGPHLRELALRCQSLARTSTDARAARELEDIGSGLAAGASSLEAIFTIPKARNV